MRRCVSLRPFEAACPRTCIRDAPHMHTISFNKVPARRNPKQPQKHDNLRTDHACTHSRRASHIAPAPFPTPDSRPFSRLPTELLLTPPWPFWGDHRTSKPGRDIQMRIRPNGNGPRSPVSRVSMSLDGNGELLASGPMVAASSTRGSKSPVLCK